MWETAAAVLVSLGGGGAIVLGLSSFLGRVWAQRLMSAETARHDRELAALRASLEATNQARLVQIQHDLSIAQDKVLLAYRDKLAAYRAVVDVVAPLLADVNAFLLRRDNAQLAAAAQRFEEGRLRLYGYLAFIAPQAVMDAHDALMDYILSALYDAGVTYDWKRVRSLALALINEARKDIGIDPSPIEYRGTR